MVEKLKEMRRFRNVMMHGFGGGGLGSTQTVAGLKHPGVELYLVPSYVQIRPLRDHFHPRTRLHKNPRIRAV